MCLFAGLRLEVWPFERAADARLLLAGRARVEDAREPDPRLREVVLAFADAFFCVRGAAMGAYSVV